MLGVNKTARIRKGMYVVCMTEIRNVYKISVGNAKGKRRHRSIRKRIVNWNHVAQNKDIVLRVIQSANILTNLFSNSFSPWGGGPSFPSL